MSNSFLEHLWSKEKLNEQYMKKCFVKTVTPQVFCASKFYALFSYHLYKHNHFCQFIHWFHQFIHWFIFHTHQQKPNLMASPGSCQMFCKETPRSLEQQLAEHRYTHFTSLHRFHISYVYSLTTVTIYGALAHSCYNPVNQPCGSSQMLYNHDHEAQ